MASIGEYGKGRKRILIVGGDGKRRTIRLGKATMKQAEAFKVKVEQLVSASITGVMEDETARWVVGLDDKTHAKLAAVDLAKARTRVSPTLKTLLDEFFAALTVKPRTKVTYSQTRRCLVDYFGDPRLLADISPL